ncbi:MAG TPA: thioredoxin domain-containing protein [Pyrinomonadaceae bacterium]|jgi:protein-disulfide isomerase|nr:thioredoxin domain-containing protein [Pyrinomonadaceae bacterium]
MRRKLPIIIIIGVLIVALAGGALLMRPSETTTRPNLAQMPPTTTAPTATASPNPQATVVPRPAAASNIAPITHLRGRNDAPLLIEEYGDFQCPPCGSLHPILKRIEGEYATQVRVAFHHFPLREMHKNAGEAARAAEAAAVQGKFWQMHDMLFEKQSEWKDAAPARPLFLGYARTLGLDLPKFTQDIDSTTVSNRVMTDEQGGTARGVTGTPTVFLNGREVPFAIATSYDKLRAVIESELAVKK